MNNSTPQRSEDYGMDDEDSYFLLGTLSSHKNVHLVTMMNRSIHRDMTVQNRKSTISSTIPNTMPSATSRDMPNAMTDTVSDTMLCMTPSSSLKMNNYNPSAAVLEISSHFSQYSRPCDAFFPVGNNNETKLSRPNLECTQILGIQTLERQTMDKKEIPTVNLSYPTQLYPNISNIESAPFSSVLEYIQIQFDNLIDKRMILSEVMLLKELESIFMSTVKPERKSQRDLSFANNQRANSNINRLNWSENDHFGCNDNCSKENITLQASWFSIMNSPYLEQQGNQTSKMEEKVYQLTLSLMKRASIAIKHQIAIISQLIFQYAMIKKINGNIEGIQVTFQEEIKKFPKANAFWGEYCQFERNFFEQLQHVCQNDATSSVEVISYLKTFVSLKNKLVSHLDQTLLCPFCLHNASKLHFTYHKTKSNWLKHIRKQCFNRIYPTEKDPPTNSSFAQVCKLDFYSLIARLTCTSHSTDCHATFSLEEDLLQNFMTLDWLPFAKHICDILYQRLQVKDAAVIAKTLAFLVELCKREGQFLKYYLEHRSKHGSLLDMLSQATGFSKYNNEIRNRANFLIKLLGKSQHEQKDESHENSRETDCDPLNSQAYSKPRNSISSFMKKMTNSVSNVFSSNHDKWKERFSREASPISCDLSSSSSMEFFVEESGEEYFPINESWEEPNSLLPVFPEETEIIVNLVQSCDIENFLKIFRSRESWSQLTLSEILVAELERTHTQDYRKQNLILHSIYCLIEEGNELSTRYFSNHDGIFEKFSSEKAEAIVRLLQQHNAMDDIFSDEVIMKESILHSPQEDVLLDMTWNSSGNAFEFDD